VKKKTQRFTGGAIRDRTVFVWKETILGLGMGRENKGMGRKPYRCVGTGNLRKRIGNLRVFKESTG